MLPLAIILAMPRLASVIALLILAVGEAEAGHAPRVLLIGVDGADPEILERLIAEDKLPTFARLKREGASGRLRSVEPLLSPIVWTSLATGRWPEDHGVFDFVEVGPDGKATPITSLRRKVPALWNVASRYGKTSGFVGWYASYPAEEVKGFIVSDRLAFHQVKSARAAEGTTFPTSLASDLTREFGEPSPDLSATRDRFAEGAVRPSGDGEKRLNELAKIHATTELYRRITPSLARRFEPKLLSVYFEVVDACGHLFMEDAPPKRAGVSEADSRAFSRTVDRCYEYQDEVLADVLRLASPDTVTLVVSDHGFKSGDRRPRTSGRVDTGQAPLWHLLHGVVLAMGPGVERGAEIQGASVLDIAPTVLTLLRLPVSRELPGKTLTEIAGKTAPRFVDRYPPLLPRAGPRVENDTEAVQRLAALGYLAGARAAMPPDPEGRTASSYLNEGAARATRGDTEGALRAFARAVQLDPGNAPALVYAARLYSERADIKKARELLGRALKLNPKDSGAHLALASLSLREGDLREAAAALAAAARVDDQLPLYHLLRARLADATRRSEEALHELEQAAALTDADALLAEIVSLRVQIEADLGRHARAEAVLRESAPLLPEATVAILRGDIALSKRDAAAAVRQYRIAATLRGGDARLERKLGKALAAAGDFTAAEAAFYSALATARSPYEREQAWGDLSFLHQGAGNDAKALEVLQKATGQLSSSGALWGALGAAYGRVGRLDDAIAAYERSVSLAPSPLACKTLALLLLNQRGDRRRAVELWRRSLTLQPGQRDVETFLRRYDPSRLDEGVPRR